MFDIKENAHCTEAVDSTDFREIPVLPKRIELEVYKSKLQLKEKNPPLHCSLPVTHAVFHRFHFFLHGNKLTSLKLH